METIATRFTRMLTLAVAMGFHSLTMACPPEHYEICVIGCFCTPTSGNFIDTGRQNLDRAVHGTLGEIAKPIHAIGKPLAEGVAGVAKGVEKAVSDINWNLQKAASDVDLEARRAAAEVRDLIAATGRFIERMGKGVGTELPHFEKRLREGKVIDAFWHFGLSPLQNAEQNAALAAGESKLLSTLGQVTAGAYGGPQGAAAYTAWLTFKQTGDPNLALKAGILAGVSSVAFGEAAKMPGLEMGVPGPLGEKMTQEEALNLLKKATVTGAIGGLAVAAGGGDAEAVKGAFLNAGGMIIIQDGYRKYTGKALDSDNLKASKAVESYCTTANANCQFPADSVIERDVNGNILKVDMRSPSIDPRVPHVGTMSAEGIGTGSWLSDAENSALMKTVSKVPGMNAMSVFHDQWAIQWNMGPALTKASILPAIVLTYIGTGAPYYEKVRTEIIEKSLQKKLTIAQRDQEAQEPPIVSPDVVTIKPAVIQRGIICSNGKVEHSISLQRKARLWCTGNKELLLPATQKNLSGLCASHQSKKRKPVRCTDLQEFVAAATLPLSERCVSMKPDGRFVESIYDRKSDSACAIQYANAKSVRTLWSSRYDRDYCAPFVDKLANRLIEKGWSCLVGDYRQ